jgi:hypothetical protein
MTRFELISTGVTDWEKFVEDSSGYENFTIFSQPVFFWNSRIDYLFDDYLFDDYHRVTTVTQGTFLSGEKLEPGTGSKKTRHTCMVCVVE